MAPETESEAVARSFRSIEVTAAVLGVATMISPFLVSMRISPVSETETPLCFGIVPFEDAS